jgi:hypothetical protein
VTATNPVSGTACPGCTVDIYSDSADEGKVCEGSTTADASGRFTFDKKPAGPFVTATATEGWSTRLLLPSGGPTTSRTIVVWMAWPLSNASTHPNTMLLSGYKTM